MQLILPSDEWFYTNHSTKYARYVKHHAARILVYIGLEKRLRNKVYLFDLLEETASDSINQPLQSTYHSQANQLIPQMSLTQSGLSDEDVFIIRTCLHPIAVILAGKDTPSGASLEGIVLDMVNQVEKRIIFGDADDDNSNNNDKSDGLTIISREMNHDKPSTKVVPPSIQVDLVSFTERGPNSGHLRSMSTMEEVSSLSNSFYFSTIPMSVNPLIVLRLIQHRMFGCVSFWSWPSTAASRSSVASSYGECRSRAGSTCVMNLEDSLMRQRKSVVLGMAGQPSGAFGGSNKLEIDRHNIRSMSTDEKWAIFSAQSGALSAAARQRASLDRAISDAAASEWLLSNSSPKKSFKFANFKRKRAKSSDVGSPGMEASGKSDSYNAHLPSSHSSSYQSHNQTSSTKEEIASFQRELQNIPRSDTPPLPPLGFYQSTLQSYLHDAMERSLNVNNSRQRSCSVPRVSFENGSLHIPGLQHHRGSSPAAAIFLGMSSLPKPTPSGIDQGNVGGPSAASRSPASLSPSSVGKGYQSIPPEPGITGAGLSGVSNLAGSVSSNSNRSIVQKDEPIMPNAHKAILSLLLEWSKLAPGDFSQDPVVRKELNDMLARVSLLGEQYRWKAEEIRISADLQVNIYL